MWHRDCHCGSETQLNCECGITWPDDPICPTCKQPCEANEVDKSICCGARLWGPKFLAAQPARPPEANLIEGIDSALQKVVFAAQRLIDECYETQDGSWQGPSFESVQKLKKVIQQTGI